MAAVCGLAPVTDMGPGSGKGSVPNRIRWVQGVGSRSLHAMCVCVCEPVLGTGDLRAACARGAWAR